MKPASFKYCRPETAEEACSLLREHGAEARVLAGGQSLVPLMNMRILQPRVLIDINRCTDLAYLRQQDGAIACGALTRQGEAEASTLVAERVPLLSAALLHVGVRASRNFGTVCGSLAHADPLAELPSVAAVLEARFVIASARGRREVHSEEFFVSALTNCLAPDEMLAEVRFPVTPARSANVFLEIANRAHGFAVAGLAICVEIGEGRHCVRARLAAMGTGDTPTRLKEVETLLEGQTLDSAIINEAGALATRMAKPLNDVHASAAYRRQVMGSLVKKALRRVVEGANSVEADSHREGKASL